MRLLALAMLLLAPPVSADSIDLLLHLEVKTGNGTPCSSTPELGAGTYDADFHDEGYVGIPYYAYIVAVNVDTTLGFLALELAIDYDGDPGAGVDVLDVYQCSDFAFTGADWPGAGGAVTFTWLSCQNTRDPSDPNGDASVLAAALYTYAYSPDVLSITYKDSGILAYTDCNTASHDITGLAGKAGFGMHANNGPYYSGGLAPCEPLDCAVIHEVPCTPGRVGTYLQVADGSWSETPIGSADPAEAACRKHVVYALPADEEVFVAPLHEGFSDIDVFVVTDCIGGEVLYQQTGLDEPLILKQDQDAYLVLRPRTLPVRELMAVTVQCAAVPVQGVNWGTIKKRYLTSEP